MGTKTINTRISMKHDTTANWNKAVNFIGLPGEIIIYDDIKGEEYESVKDELERKGYNVIKFDFQKDSNILIISGSFYHYHEWGAQWGKSESKLEKITKKVLIDRATNNVIKVETKEETVRKGNADGKSYWDHHSDYCMSDMTKKSVNTSAFDNVKKAIRYYLYNDAEVHQTWANNQEAIERHIEEQDGSYPIYNVSVNDSRNGECDITS